MSGLISNLHFLKEEILLICHASFSLPATGKGASF